MYANESLGHDVLNYFIEFIKHGSVILLLISVFSVVAEAIIFFRFKFAWAFLVIGVLSSTGLITGMYLREKLSGELKGEEEPSDKWETVAAIGFFFIYFTSLMFGTAISASYLNEIFGLGLISIAISAYYPAVDFYLLKNHDISIGSLPAISLLYVLQISGWATGVTPGSLVDALFRNPLSTTISNAAIMGYQ